MIGQTLCHYQFVARISEGAMGTVYRAEDLRNNRVVAVKMIRPSQQNSKTVTQRFAREAVAIAKIDHPNVVSLYEVIERGDVHFMVMEYVAGSSLRALLRRERMRVSEVARIACEVTSGLAEAHRCGVIHRDIKPENIIVTDSGLCKILDFGVARLTGVSTFVGKRRIIGTLPYIAPEQVKGGRVDGRADVYSVGVILFEMLTGTMPFEIEEESTLFYQVLNVDPPSVRTLAPATPEELDVVIRRALRKDPEDRYSSMEEMRNALQPIVSGLRTPMGSHPVICGEASLWKRVSRWWRHH